MKTLEERAKSFEAEYQRNQELLFRIKMRRDKLFGLWAANQLGLPAGEAAESYARDVVAADFNVPDDRDILGKVAADLEAHGVPAREIDLIIALERADIEAHRQLQEI